MLNLIQHLLEIPCQARNDDDGFRVRHGMTAFGYTLNLRLEFYAT
jgi:hypothetical protein